MMRNRMLAAVAGVVILGGVVRGQTTKPAVAVVEGPFEVMERLYAPLCVGGDALSWPMKVDAASAGELKFSTSTRELFYRWAKVRCADWLGDRGAFVQSHGDVHLGNMGSYVADLKSVRMALGLKDFDETALMPFQTDLLQAMVTLRLTARENGLELSAEQLERVVGELTESYRSTMEAGQSATEALRDDAEMGKLLEVGKKTLRTAVDEWVEGGRFKRVIVSKKGEVRDLFRPALKQESVVGGGGEGGVEGIEKAELGNALARAVAASPRLAKVVSYRTAGEWEDAIEDAVFRTRPGSGGSQGMVKMMVYVRAGVKTLDGGSTDAIFYLKQQATGSAGQRAGFVEMMEVPGGRRVSGGAVALTSPEVDAVGWCDLRVAGAERSFFVTVRDPWEDEPGEKLDSEEKVMWAARVMGTVLGAAHRNAVGGEAGARGLAARVGPGLRGQLVERSGEWVVENGRLFKAWREDERVKKLREQAKAAWAEATGAK